MSNKTNPVTVNIDNHRTIPAIPFSIGLAVGLVVCGFIAAGTVIKSREAVSNAKQELSWRTEDLKRTELEFAESRKEKKFISDRLQRTEYEAYDLKIKLGNYDTNYADFKYNLTNGTAIVKWVYRVDASAK